MEKGEFMRIFKLEFQKIMKNPMLWLLAVIFCLVNCLVIYNEAGNKDTSKELVIMHDIIKKTDDINHSRQAKNRNERKQLSKAYQEYYKENIDAYTRRLGNLKKKIHLMGSIRLALVVGAILSLWIFRDESWQWLTGITFAYIIPFALLMWYHNKNVRTKSIRRDLD